MNKRLILFSICLVLCIAAIPIGVVAFAAPSASSQNKNNVTGVTDSGVELPQLGEDYISEEFAMPDPGTLEKQWYEYVVFSKDYEEVDEQYVDYYLPTARGAVPVYATAKVRYYMPEGDYVNSTVMTYAPLEMTTAKENGNVWKQEQEIVASGEYTTASSVTVSYSVSNAYALGFSESLTTGIELGSEEGAGTGLLGIKILNKMKIEVGLSSSQTMQTSKNQSISRTFEKLDGVDRPWRVVQYNVQIPVRIDIFKKGRLSDSGYFLVNIMTGTCRQWADGTIEHWQTGERVTIADFEADFCTADAIKNRERQNWN